MKKCIITLIVLVVISSTYAQSDTFKNIIKFNFDINNVFENSNIDINYFGYERAISSNSSLVFWVNYDFNSSNLKVGNVENVVTSQALRTKFDYRYYFSKSRRLFGFYLYSSLVLNLNLISEGNENFHEGGVFFGLGYQKIWKDFVMDIKIDKGYKYSAKENDNIEFINSTITPFALSVSIGYNF